MAQTDWSEQPWYNPEAVEYFQGINSSNLHLYFANSPFFDQTCNNAFLLQQANSTQEVWDIVQVRARFEAELRKMAGIEYIVTEDPPPGTDPRDSIWVIKKQEREKIRVPRKEGSREWIEEVTQVKEVLGTYYVVESLIYEAPSVEKVLESKLLTIQNCLTKFLSAATQLPLFDSVAGHHYLSQSAIAAKAAKEAQRTLRAQSRAGSVAPSPRLAGLEGSVDSLTSTSKSTQDTTNAFDDLALLAQSFQLSTRYSSEYMDENPLHGEPGSFVFASSTDHLRALQQAQQAKNKNQGSTLTAVSSNPSRVGSTSGTPAPTIKTEELPQARKGSSPGERSPTSPAIAKLKRKRTAKTIATSPTISSPT